MKITKMTLLHYVKISFCTLSLLFSLCLSAEQIDLNFDSLFPTTWYEKGLASTMHVWHTMVQIFESKTNEPFPFDTLLAKLTFCQFCIERMQHEEQVSDDDSNYLSMAVNKIQDLLAMIVVTPVIRDRLDCMMDMVMKMQQMLNPSHVPSNIDAIRSAKDIGIKCSFTSNF